MTFSVYIPVINIKEDMILAQKDTTQRPSRISKYCGNIKHYQYDKSKLMSILIDAEDDLTKLNWKITSQDVSLRNRSGIWPGNGGHVRYLL